MKYIKILREELGIIDENITAGQSIVWHRTKYKNLKEIQKKGFFVGDRGLLGNGVYACFEFDSQLNSKNTQNYGEIILECRINSLDNILILMPSQAKKVYPGKWKFRDQLRSILGDKKYKELNIEQHIPIEICNDIDNGKYENIDSIDLYDKYIIKFKDFLDGIIYNSDDDGRCIVCYNDKNISPLRYTTNNGQEWVSLFNSDVFDRDYNKTIPSTNKKLQTLSSREIVSMLIKNSKAINNVDVNKIETKDLVSLLKMKPEMITHLNIGKMHNYTIVEILKVVPDLADYFDLNKIYPDLLDELLEAQPSLFNKVYPPKERKKGFLGKMKDLYNKIIKEELAKFNIYNN